MINFLNRKKFKIQKEKVGLDIFGCYNQIASDLIPKEKEGIRLLTNGEEDNQIMLLGFSNLK